MHYIYTQSLPSDSKEFIHLIDKAKSHDNQNWLIAESCIEAYKLAEHLCAPIFRAAINNHFIDRWSKGLADMDIFDKQSLIRIAFQGITGERVLLQFLVDRYCEVWRLENMYEQNAEEHLPRKSLLRCVRRYCELQNVPQEGKQERCYLEHVNEGGKEACAKLHMRWDEEAEHGFFE